MAARKKNTTPAPDAESAGRQAALDRALDQIEKTYGKGSIMRLEGDGLTAPPGIGTGSLSLDLALVTATLSLLVSRRMWPAPWPFPSLLLVQE